MATGVTISNDSVSTVSGYCLFARARCGLNGASSGTDEVATGRSSTNCAGTQKIWDANLSDGLDSGWVFVELSCGKNGGTSGVTWKVTAATSDPVAFSGVSYGAVGRVRLRAAVRIGAAVSWRFVSIKWHKNGRVVESFAQSSGPQVDTQATPGEAEQILAVTPNGTTHDKVVVSGDVLLVCPEGTVPEADDLLAEIFVDCASCTNL